MDDKYIIVKSSFDFLKQVDRYKTSSFTKFLFKKAGYKVYLDKLKEPVTKHHASVHAFFLMTHHVHLLMTAPSIVGISQVMQNLEGIMLGT